MSEDFALDIPDHLLKAAIEIDVFFRKNGHEQWAFHGCASRKWLQQLEAENEELRDALKWANRRIQVVQTDLEKALDQLTHENKNQIS